MSAGIRFHATFCALVLALLSAAWVWVPAQASAAGYSIPTGISAVSRSRSGISVGWRTSPGATRYRVRFADNQNMVSPRYVETTTASAEATGLATGRPYWFQVRVLNEAGTSALTNYSAPTRFETRSATSTFTHLNPRGFEAEPHGSTEVALSWVPRGVSLRYRVQYSTSSSWAPSAWVETTATNRVLTGLRPSTKYYLRVRVISSSGTGLSDYSPVVSVTTMASRGTPGAQVISRARTGLAFAWAPVAGVTRYRLRYSTSQTMSSPRYATTESTRVDLTGLSSSRTYYVQVRSISAEGGGLSPYGPVIKTGTRESSHPYVHLSPNDLVVQRAAAAPAVSATVSFTARTGVSRYRVRYARTAAMTDSATARFSWTSGTLGNLAPGSSYYVQVRTVDSEWVGSSEYTPPVKVTIATSSSPPTAPHPLRVATYNVTCHTCYNPAVALDNPWWKRKDSVASTILTQRPDVIGVQEAAQSVVRDPTTGVSLGPQFQDLVNALGTPYRVTNSYQYNCERSTSSSSCVYRDRGASQGTRIIYNASTLGLVRQGSAKLPELDPAMSDRYLAWAVFEQESSGSLFFFGSVHLESTKDPAGSTKWADLRVRQAETAWATIRAKAGGLPVILVGDLNSHRNSSPANGPYDTFVKNGLVDPLGNAGKSTYNAPGATVEHRVNTHYASNNAFRRSAAVYPYPNGTHIDYILTTPMRVTEFENAVKVDRTTGEFLPVLAGGDVILASDHNLLRATVHLP